MNIGAPEIPYIVLELRWGSGEGGTRLGAYERDYVAVGVTRDDLKEQAAEMLATKMDNGETVVSCSVHHMGVHGSQLLGAWHYDADVHSAPVWAAGSTP
jgi:hypothetical protein